MKKLILLPILLSIFQNSYNQEYKIPTSGTDTIITCSGKLSAQFKNNEYVDGTISIKPEVDSSYITLTIDTLNFVSHYNRVYISNFNANRFSYLSTYTNNDAPYEVISTDPSGALRIRFISEEYLQGDTLSYYIGCYQYNEIPSPDAEALSTDYEFPSTVRAGDQIYNYPYRIKNNSPYLQQIEYNIFLSDDSIYSENDLKIGYYEMQNTLKPGESIYNYLNFRIPSQLDSNNYYIITIVDPYNKLTETNENNNFTSNPIIIDEADVEIDASYNNSTIKLSPGLKSNVPLKIRNKGESRIDSLNIEMYISSDNILDPSDSLVFLDYTYSIQAFGEIDYNAEVQIDFSSNWESGTYYLITKADANNEYNEENEENNTTYTIIIIDKPTSDIKLKRIESSSQFALSSSRYNFILNYSLTKGPHARKLGFYLSTDDKLSTDNDSLLSIVSVSNQNDDAYIDVWKNFYCDIPNVEEGSYNLIITTIDDSLFNDFQILDNIITKPIDVKINTGNNYFYDIYPDISSSNIQKVTTDDSQSLPSTVFCTGSQNNDSIFMECLLSTDSVLDNDDVLIGENSLIVTWRSYINYNQEFNIPHDITPGEYFILLKATGSSDSIEFDYSNNITFQEITIVENNYVQATDYTLLSYSCPDTINYNEFTVTGEVYNDGKKSSSNSSTIGYFLSSDNILDHSDQLLNISGLNTYALDFGKKQNFYNNLSIPNSIQDGEYTLIIKLDASNLVEESNENNNIIVHPLYISLNSSEDWKLYSKEVEQLVYPGDVINQQYQINDWSSTWPKQGKISYYITQQPIRPINTKTIQTDSIYSFLNGYIADVNCKIQDTITEGRYYFWAYYESLDGNNDPDTTNNFAMHPIWVDIKDQDISISNFNTSKKYTIGGDCGINLTLKNNSYRRFRSVDIDIYVSNDSIFNKSDDIFGETITVNKIFPESELEISEDISLGFLDEMKEYYIMAYIDPAKYPYDIDISNNLDSSKIYFIPSEIDFNIQSISFNDTITLDVSNSFSMVVKNEGTESFGGYLYSGLYLSEDTMLDKNDILLDHRQKSLSSYYSSWTYNFYTLNNIASIEINKSYYLLFKVDSDNSVGELTESNNIKYGRVYIKESVADLVIDSVDMFHSITPGIFFGSRIYLSNSGDVEVNAYKQIAILSTDSILDLTEDIWLDIDNNNYTVYPGYTSQINYGSLISYEIPYGEYYMFLIVDFFNEQTEANKENNIYRTKLTIEKPTYDLSLPAALSSQELKTGQNANNYLETSNLSNTFVDYIEIDIWLSKDTILNDSDTLLSTSTSYYTLGPGDSRSIYNRINIPLDADTGDFFLLYEASLSNDTLIDVDLSNNIAIQAIKILEATTDLNVESYSSDLYQVETGSYINLSCEIKNIGTEYTYSSTMAYMLSNDSIFDSNDYLLGTDYVSSMYSGNSSYESIGAYIPNGYSGINYILFVADYYNNIAENNEDNNIKAQEILINSEIIDEDSLDFSITELSLYQLDDTLTIDYQITKNSSQWETVFLEFWLTQNTGSIDGGSIMLFSDSVVMSADQYSNNTWIHFSSIDSSYNYLTLKLIADDDYYDNNIRSIAIENGYIAPKDIAVYERYSADYWLQDNNYLVFDYYLNNNSNSNIDSSIISYYLFDDQIYNLGSRVFQLDKYNNSHITDSVLIEQTLNRELPIIKIIADPDNLIEETDEDNNSISYYFNYDLSSNDFDLMITDQSLHNNLATPGGIVSTSFGIKNTGKDPIKNTDVGIYISKDENWTFDDIFLDDYHIQEIIANDSALGVKSLIIPESIDTGYYFVLYIADFTNKFVETNELNNVENNLIYITNEIEHDLGLSVNLDSNYVKNDTLEYKGYLTNKGILNCQDIIINVYFSFDNNLDDFDVLLESIKIDELLFNDSTNLVDKITLPPGIQPGDYYLIFSVISDNEFYDSDFRNNVNATLFTFDQSSSVSFSQIANVNLYPNPAESEIYVTSDYNFTEAYIIELNGKVIFNQTITGNSYKFNIDKLTNGMYILKLINNDKVVIKRFYKK